MNNVSKMKKGKTNTSCKKEILKTSVNMFNVNDLASMFSIQRHHRNAMEYESIPANRSMVLVVDRSENERRKKKERKKQTCYLTLELRRRHHDTDLSSLFFIFVFLLFIFFFCYTLAKYVTYSSICCLCNLAIKTENERMERMNQSKTH